jgi:signal transduction histidine kinase
MLTSLFDSQGLAPHGFCLSWRADLFWSLAISDGLIAISYLSISGAIITFLMRRRDMYLRTVAVAFALFIFLCAASHSSDIVTLWAPDYGAQVAIKALTAAVSVITAAALWPLLPYALSLPSAAQMAVVNTALSHENQERKAVEASLRATERELRAANNELDSFAYAVSHDLRAPLRAMNGFSQALAEDFADRLDDDGKSYLAEIGLATRHMGELIDGLLVLSRATRGELQRDQVDLSAMAERIRDDLAKSEPDRSVRWAIEPGISVWGDRRMIDIVMRNLLTNAWTYTGRTAQAAIRVFVQPTSSGQRVCVTDNGAGFDQRHAGKLFTPFQRLHRQDEFAGLGVGLSTVGRIIERHGGNITGDGVVGQGATFSFLLPEPGADEESRNDRV